MRESCQIVIDRLEELIDLLSDNIEEIIYIKTRTLVSIELNAKDCDCISQKDQIDINNNKFILESKRVKQVKRLQELIGNIKGSCTI